MSLLVVGGGIRFLPTARDGNVFRGVLSVYKGWGQEADPASGKAEFVLKLGRTPILKFGPEHSPLPPPPSSLSLLMTMVGTRFIITERPTETSCHINCAPRSPI